MERGDLFLLSYGFLGPIYSQNSDLFAKRRVASLDFFAGVLQILWLDICCSDSMNQNWESLGEVDKEEELDWMLEDLGASIEIGTLELCWR